MSTSRPERGSLNFTIGIRAFGISWMSSIPSSWRSPESFLKTFDGVLFLKERHRSRSPVPIERSVTLEPNASTTALFPNRLNNTPLRCLVSDSLLLARASPIFLRILLISPSRACTCWSLIEVKSGISISSTRCL